MVVGGLSPARAEHAVPRSVSRKTTAMGGVAALVPVLAAAVTAKIVAVHGGPDGLGELAQISAWAAVVGLVGDIGVGAALPRTVGTLSPEDAQRAVWAVRWLTLAASTLAVATGALLAELGMIPSTLASGLVLGGLMLLVGQETAIIAAQRVQHAWNLAISARAVGAGVTAAGLLGWARWSIAASLIAAAIVSLAIVVPVAARVGSLRPPRTLDRRLLRTLVHDGAELTIGVVVGATVFAALPILVAQSSGNAASGRFRAAMLPSGALLAAVATLYASVVYPRMAAALGSDQKPAADRGLPGAGLAFRLIEMVAVTCAVMAFLPVILPLLTSQAFVGLESTWRIVLACEAIRCVQWTLAYALIADGHRRWFIVGQAISGALALTFVSVGALLRAETGAAIGLAVASVGSAFASRVIATGRPVPGLLAEIDKRAIRAGVSGALTLVLGAAPAVWPIVAAALVLLWRSTIVGWVRQANPISFTHPARSV